MVLRKLAAVGAAAAGLVLVAGPALASAPYIVTVNGSSTGSVSVVGTNKDPVVLTDNGLNLTCNTSTITVNVTAGTYNTDPAAIGTIDPASFSDCDFESFPATVTPHTPWTLNVTGGNTPATNDTISGTLTGVDADVSIMGPLGTCSFTVTGTVNGTFKEDNAKLGQELDAIPGPGLAISNVNNAVTCVGLVSNGDAPTFTGSYNTPGQPVLIS